MNPLWRGDRARLLRRDGARLVAQIDHNNLVADPVHLDEAMVGERAHGFVQSTLPYMANGDRLTRWRGGVRQLRKAVYLCRCPVPGGEAHEISVNIWHGTNGAPAC